MPAAVLHVVATPIGNLGDLSPRARQVLSEVAAICGGAGLTLASARPVAPSCLRPR